MSEFKYVNLSSDSFEAYILFNTICSDIEFSVKEIGFCHATPGYRKIFTSDDYILHYIIHGKGTFAGKSVCAGDGFLIKPSSLIFHQASDEESFEHCWIILTGFKVREILSSCNISLESHVFHNTHAIHIAKLIKKAVMQDYQGQDLELSLKSLIYKILSFHISRQDVPASQAVLTSDYITHATAFIRENYSKPIKISDIAKSVNLSQNHLCKLFNKTLNCSLKTYLVKYRLSIAKTFLKQTNLSVTEIANSVGYDDSMYFSQVFRKYNNCTPSEFRELKSVKNTSEL